MAKPLPDFSAFDPAVVARHSAAYVAALPSLPLPVLQDHLRCWEGVPLRSARCRRFATAMHSRVADAVSRRGAVLALSKS